MNSLEKLRIALHKMQKERDELQRILSSYPRNDQTTGLQFSIRSLVVHRPGLHLSVIELSTRSSECAKNVNNSPISVLITIAILGCILFFTLLSYV